jgi:hypothetical protein
MPDASEARRKARREGVAHSRTSSVFSETRARSPRRDPWKEAEKMNSRSVAIATAVAGLFAASALSPGVAQADDNNKKVACQGSAIAEHEFLAAVAARSGCGILLDVNNVFVSSKNHDCDAAAYVDAIPAHAIGQLHLAGHSDCGTHLLDTHDAPVSDPVWQLYARLVERVGPVSTLIEWDDAIPPLDRLVAESRHAQEVEASALDRSRRSTKEMVAHGP